MMEALFFILLVLAILLILLSIEFQDNIFWCSTFIITDIILWFTLAASILELERPYTLYNASSNAIESGYSVYTSPVSPYLTYLFMLFAAVMMIYYVGYILGPAIMKKWMR